MLLRCKSTPLTGTSVFLSLKPTSTASPRMDELQTERDPPAYRLSVPFDEPQFLDCLLH